LIARKGFFVIGNNVNIASEQQSPNHIKHQRTRQGTARAGGLREVRRQLLHDGAA